MSSTGIEYKKGQVSICRMSPPHWNPLLHSQYFRVIECQHRSGWHILGERYPWKFRIVLSRIVQSTELIMFETPALVSFVLDGLIVVLYFNSPWIFGDSLHISILDMNPLKSMFTLVIVAGLRIVAFIPYIWHYQHDRHIVLAQVPYLWHSFNLVLILLKSIWELTHQSWDIFLWSMLLGSAVSVLCQSICLNHLISTAVPERNVILGFTGFAGVEDSAVSLLESRHSDEGLLHDDSYREDNHGDTFIQSLKSSLQEAREKWNSKIEKLKGAIVDFARSSSLADMNGDVVVFEELLILFTDSHSFNKASGSENTIANILRLYGTYPGIVTFYVPQLVVFLIYGAFDTTAKLRAALLSMCEHSAYFAHRMHWFIQSFCASGAGVDAEGVAALQQLLRQIESHGMVPCECMASGHAEGEPGHEGIGYSSPPLTVPPLESTRGSGERSISGGNSDGSDVNQTQAPSITPNYIRFPIEMTRQAPSGQTSYSVNILFWERLAQLSRELCTCQRDNRTSELRQQLSVIQSECLPSATIYAPVSNVHHRIWAIHCAESFAFSTKDRAPMFVCLEVVDYQQPEQKRSVPQTAPSWVTDIGESIRRTFTLDRRRSHGDDLDEVDDDEEPSDENDAQLKQWVQAESPCERRRSTGTHLRETSSGLFDVGQWTDSPARHRARHSIDGHKRESDSSSTRKKLFLFPGLNKSTQTLKLDEESGRADLSVALSVGAKIPAASANDPDIDRDHTRPIVVFKERWRDKEKRLRSLSAVGNLPGYRLLPVIVKSNDDLRQEECAGQLIYQMNQILVNGKVDGWLRPYGIVAMSPDCGIIEAIPDTVSFDVLRRRVPQYTDLKNFFESFFGTEETTYFQNARDNFVKSLGAYCIVCYLLQIKDRHNGNILLDRHGHVIHIDFGFILGLTPGGNIGFESAPFKLTSEMVDLMGGIQSPHFYKFREVCVKTYMELRRNYNRVVVLLEMLSVGNEHLPFFMGNPQRTLEELRQRFKPNVHDNAAIEHVQGLIDLATDNWTTSCYDKYQRCCVGVF